MAVARDHPGNDTFPIAHNNISQKTVSEEKLTFGAQSRLNCPGNNSPLTPLFPESASSTLILLHTYSERQ